ncbi:MAG: YceI family protein [Acidobacteria bacterium]|nr:YceI family protein [Acidobacteriota bacterium]
MSVTETTRTIPAAGTWKLDPSHSTVGFSVKHLGISRVKGRFGAFEGTVRIGEQPEDSAVEVSIQADSIDTRDEGRDGHLRTGDFLAVEDFPVLTYLSTGVSGHDDHWHVNGELTIRGVTRPVSLDVRFEGTGTDPWGGERAGFTATAEINREDFGLTYNQVLEAGGLLVGKNVRIELEVQLVREQPAA